MSCIFSAVTDIPAMRFSTESLIHQTLHASKTRLTPPSVRTCIDRVMWNTPVRVTCQVVIHTTAPYTISTLTNFSFEYEFILLTRETDSKCRLPAKSVFPKPSVQYHLPQDCREGYFRL
ncbi:hypothetical protein TNCV_1309371 [Trichonephila clavipes]|nr:hypothetical protein TNCV_1309371 [Trichonephila clavipes]